MIFVIFLSILCTLPHVLMHNYQREKDKAKNIFSTASYVFF